MIIDIQKGYERVKARFPKILERLHQAEKAEKREGMVGG